MYNVDYDFYSFSIVGKTSLITRFMYDSFDNTYQVSFILISLNIMSHLDSFLYFGLIPRLLLELIFYQKQCILKTEQ